jgi:hypothetical protein
MEVTRSDIRRIWWLDDGWNLVLRQKMLHCEGGVTGCFVMVHDPTGYLVTIELWERFDPSSYILCM